MENFLYLFATVGIVSLSSFVSFAFRNAKYYLIHKSMIKDEKDVLIESLKERNDLLKEENSQLKSEINKISGLIYNSLQN